MLNVDLHILAHPSQCIVHFCVYQRERDREVEQERKRRGRKRDIFIARPCLRPFSARTRTLARLQLFEESSSCSIKHKNAFFVREKENRAPTREPYGVRIRVHIRIVNIHRRSFFFFLPDEIIRLIAAFSLFSPTWERRTQRDEIVDGRCSFSS